MSVCLVVVVRVGLNNAAYSLIDPRLLSIHILSDRIDLQRNAAQGFLVLAQECSRLAEDSERSSEFDVGTE